MSSVVAIAQQLSHANAEQSPLILLALNNLLEGDECSAKEKQSARRQIWRCDLLHIIVEVLRQDFTLVTGQWDTAAKLATLLSSVCVGLKPKLPEQQNIHGEKADQVTEYYDILLPTAVDSLLILANNLMELGTAHIAKGDPQPHFFTVADALTWLCSNHQQCIQRALQSPYLLNIFISDEAAYSSAALEFIATTLKSCPGVFSTLSSETMQSILDELVYKISGTDSHSALPALDLLGAFVKSGVTLLDNLLSAYKGLSVVIFKWNAYHLGPDATQLVTALGARANFDQERDRTNSAAVLIQAVWRGYVCRKKMRRFRRGICRFQQLYRRWKLDKGKVKQEKAQVTSRATYTAQRKFHEQQIATLKLLPACEIAAFVARQEEQAAVKIQAWWRGEVARKALQEKRAATLRTRSAGVIQKAVRRYLQRGKKRTTVENLYPELTCAERELLQQEIHQLREREPQVQSSEQRRQLHDQVQQLLGDFYADLRYVRRKDEQRCILLAQLEEGCDRALSAPPLHHASNELVELYTSGSRFVASMAQTAHREELKAMLLPWWKKTMEDDPVSLDDPVIALLS